jgi:hypothetical protein
MVPRPLAGGMGEVVVGKPQAVGMYMMRRQESVSALMAWLAVFLAHVQRDAGRAAIHRAGCPRHPNRRNHR